jgi:hypothetical protein
VFIGAGLFAAAGSPLEVADPGHAMEREASQAHTTAPAMPQCACQVCDPGDKRHHEDQHDDAADELVDFPSEHQCRPTGDHGEKGDRERDRTGDVVLQRRQRSIPRQAAATGGGSQRCMRMGRRQQDQRDQQERQPVEAP